MQIANPSSLNFELYWLYNLSDPLRTSNEHGGQGSGTRMQRSPQQVWSKATSHQSLHGRSQSDNSCTRSQVDPPGVGEHHGVDSSFKPAKSRSLVLKKGKVTDKFRFRLGEHRIPSVTEKPMKSLGKVINCSLNDRDSIKATSAELEGWLRTVDKSGLPGRFKAWHGILPIILWPLLTYEVPMTVVEGFEQRVSSYLCRCLGLPCSLSNIGLHGKTNKLRLPFSSVREEFIVARAREHLQYSGSRDAKVSGAGIVVRTGRKWRAADAVQQAETRLKHKAILGTVAQGRAGLVSRAVARYDSASGRERQRLVQEEVRASVDEERTSRAVAMRQQGAWMNWEQAMERSVTWKDIWQWNPQRIKFLIQGVYDVLPSPSNLCIWGKIETPACLLCSKIGTLEHILSSCSKALGEGWYRWRHDQSIAEAISKGIKGRRRTQATAKTIHFVKEGQRPEKTPRNRSAGLLPTARDWVMSVDLERQLKIPPHITQTRSRPDIILVSEATKKTSLAGADRSMGGEDGGGSGKKEGEVPGAGGGLDC
ncbi:hypothetical protein N1851_014501 [Merluccius polli]|uniref:Reverse transcriptase n=1 Tax=Merluccius polli TaxID=89951 RepID=A0AA47MU74_MERPO|nr:hypothetical protein N1851_014501 [Merluccius polli]